MTQKYRRNHRLDFLRIVFSTLVLLAHAPELTDGNGSREILTRLTHQMSFGELAVDGFFLLSGYLIVQSWLGDPELINFLRKRILRIVPGYTVAFVLSVLVAGFLAPGVPNFFHKLNGHLITSFVQLSGPATPPVFPTEHYQVANNSLWTITFEFRCYLVCALFGLCGWLRRPLSWLTAALLLMAGMLAVSMGFHSAPRSIYHITGTPELLCRLFGAFFIGGCFHLFHRNIKFRPGFGWLALLLSFSAAVFAHTFMEPVLIVCGGYLMFYFSQLRGIEFRFMNRLPDISYGIYLYGWPVEALWIRYRAGSPWITFLASTIICFGVGWVSWHFVERPALTLKRRATAPLPAP